ncbi:ferric reductase-like protein like transmembrane component [Xylogone sp. PMI_703]|nr:ferric reductase-like protein like transmembrane component [Xylogone sp. PMI_703]
MGWPYRFPELSKAEVHARRLTLDRYGQYAQLSCLIPVVVYQLYRLAEWVYAARQKAALGYAAVPGSPVAKKFNGSALGSLARKWRKWKWWLEGEVAPGWGLREQWMGGIAWAAWLLFLCINQTGDDYFHITKRFGTVAASQFPIHYMLSMKSRISPLLFLFQTSDVEINKWHRVTGKIIIGLLFLHATFYTNYFVQKGILLDRLTHKVPFIGVLAFTSMLVLGTTSLATIRRWSYRVFFVLHLVIGVALLPLLFFHTHHLRIYMIESLFLFIIDIAARKLDTITEFAILSHVPGAKLVKIIVPVPPSKIAKFRTAPGQHVYLSIPPQSVPRTVSTSMIHELLFNPFSIADVSTTDMTLVVRACNGPTTIALGELANLTKAKPPLNIEGPYGTSRHFPNLAETYDRILLVAGGVGATFILPIYRSLKEQLDDAASSDKVTFIWSMRSAAEASWAIDSEERSLVNVDEDIKLFVTRGKFDDVDGANERVSQDGTVELEELNRVEESIKVRGGHHRPHLQKIVDDTFSHGKEERVAVLVCGPKDMANELRKHVGDWVKKGRDVWWHDETFGW